LGPIGHKQRRLMGRGPSRLRRSCRGDDEEPLHKLVIGVMGEC
jgi:hypothetical protein